MDEPFLSETQATRRRRPLWFVLLIGLAATVFIGCYSMAINYSPTTSLSTASVRTCSNPTTAFWMRKHQTVPINTLTLLGSHDAGCIQGQSGAWTERLAATQSKDLFGQMCGGWRVFDIRFKRTKGEWKIHHGGYFFNNMSYIAADVGEFAARSPSELVILRIKIENGFAHQRMNAVKQFAELIDTAAKDSCVLRTASQSAPNFMSSTIEELHRHVGDCGPVAFMIHFNNDGKKEKRWNKYVETVDDLEKIIPDETFWRLAYRYNEVQFGKYSDSWKVSDVFRGDRAQYKNLQEWKQLSKPGVSFGFWMTLTFGDSMGGWMRKFANIYEGTKAKLFDGGKYCGWFFQLVAHYAGRDLDQMEGWTVWTDFAGDDGLESVALDAITLNDAVHAAGMANNIDVRYDSLSLAAKPSCHRLPFDRAADPVVN